MIPEYLQAFSALLFVLAILALAAWGMKRYGLVPGQPRHLAGKKQINIIESRMIDGRNRLVVVEWKGKEYLIATHSTGVTPISSTKTDFKEMVAEHETDKTV